MVYKIFIASFRSGRNGYDNFIVAEDIETAKKLAKAKVLFAFAEFYIRRAKAADFSDWTVIDIVDKE